MQKAKCEIDFSTSPMSESIEQQRSKKGTKMFSEGRKLKNTAYLTKVVQYAIDSTKDCAVNRIPYLSVHKIHLIRRKQK